jgi:hypothetical protein
MTRPTKHEPDPRFFGEAGTITDQDHDVYMGSGRIHGDMQGEGRHAGGNPKPRDHDDERFFSHGQFGHGGHAYTGVRTHGGPPNEEHHSSGPGSTRWAKDAETHHLERGDPIEASEIASGASPRAVDRLRNESKYDRRTQPQITNSLHRSIASENADYNE